MKNLEAHLTLSYGGIGLEAADIDKAVRRQLLEQSKQDYRQI